MRQTTLSAFLTQNASDIELRRNLSLSKLSTINIGAPADCVVFPNSAEQLIRIVSLARRNSINHKIIGYGSNVLFRDLKACEDLIICTKKVRGEIQYSGSSGFHVSAGIGLPTLAKTAANMGFGGISFAAGIPGSLGGGLAMNAGTGQGATIGDFVSLVDAIDMKGNLIQLTKEELDFGYRRSAFVSEDLCAVGAFVKLPHVGCKEAKTKIEEALERRKVNQPIGTANFGSTFKRPSRYNPGELIEKAGLKGKRIGGAQVSLKHANFIENVGNASSQDVLRLINLIKTEVYRDSKVKLEEEIHIW